MARKPLIGTVAQNVLAHGTGALNIDGCRIAHRSDADLQESERKNQHTRYANPNSNRDSYSGEFGPRDDYDGSLGRWPANVCLDEAAAEMLDAQSGERRAAGQYPAHARSGFDHDAAIYGKGMGDTQGPLYADHGGASRFFYVAKASRRERNAGLEGMPERAAGVLQARAQEAGTYDVRVHNPDPAVIAAYLKSWRTRAGLSHAEMDKRLGTVTMYSWYEGRPAGTQLPAPSVWWRLKEILGFDDQHDVVMTETRPVERTLFDDRPRVQSTNPHPTVKPIALMRWLVRLVCPPGGVVLDPFAGSGTTGCAAVLEGFRFVGIEQDAEYAAIAERRIDYWSRQRPTAIQPALPLEGVAD